jgi:hypothetical protein
MNRRAASSSACGILFFANFVRCNALPCELKTLPTPV